MFTEDKVTELFCMADNFCKFFDKMRQNIGVCLVFHGLKSPRLFNFPSFRRRLYADIIKPEA